MCTFAVSKAERRGAAQLALAADMARFVAATRVRYHFRVAGHAAEAQVRRSTHMFNNPVRGRFNAWLFDVWAYPGFVDRLMLGQATSA